MYYRSIILKSISWHQWDWLYCQLQCEPIFYLFLLHFLFSTRWCPPCLSLTSSFFTCCLCASLWQRVLLDAYSSSSISLIDSQVLVLVLCQHCPLFFITLFISFLFQLLFTYITISSSLLYLQKKKPSKFTSFFLLICNLDYSGWQSLSAEALVEKYINIYVNTKASSGLFVCVVWLKCQLNLSIASECMATGPMNNWEKYLMFLKVHVFSFQSSIQLISKWILWQCRVLHSDWPDIVHYF